MGAGSWGLVEKMDETQGQRPEDLMSWSGHSQGPSAKAIPHPRTCLNSQPWIRPGLESQIH